MAWLLRPIHPSLVQNLNRVADLRFPAIVRLTPASNARPSPCPCAGVDVDHRQDDPAADKGRRASPIAWLHPATTCFG